MLLKHSVAGGEPEPGPDAVANPEKIVREAGIFSDGLVTGKPARGHRRVTKPWVHVTKVRFERKDYQRYASNAGSCGQSRYGNEVVGMKTSFNVAEEGSGSYRLLAMLRWVMVVIFVSFGIQKFTLQSAQGIVQFISNSPFVSWLSIFGLRGEAYFLGTVELGIAALLAAGAFSPILSAIGSLMGVFTFAVTWSFFFTTPGVVKWSLSTDPIAWNLTGEFIFKDIVLLCVCAVLFLASLPQSVIRSRSV
jgi:uncharacterized membrane protein YkgB